MDKNILKNKIEKLINHYKAGNFVYVIKDGKAWRRNISLGQAVADRFVIISGLKDGETVATRGNEKLKPGKKIKIVEK